MSQPIQSIVSDLLTDDAFLDAYLEDARARLGWAYKVCVRKLEEMVVPYVPNEAGLFVYADFSALLPPGDLKDNTPTFEGEERFGTLMEQAAGVVMTPGRSQRDSRPG